MTDDTQNDEIEVPIPEIPASLSFTADSSVGLLSLVLNQLRDSERRILKRIAEIEDRRERRWDEHVAEHMELEASLKSIHDDLHSHLRTEEKERLVWQARTGPVKRGAAWASREWRTLAIVALLVLDFIASISDQLRQLLGNVHP